MAYQNKQKEDKKNQLERVKRKLEKTPEYSEWKKYLALQPMDKSLLKTKWSEYYEQVRESKQYKRYIRQRELLALIKDSKNPSKYLEEIKDISKEAKKDTGPFLPKPSMFDPELLVISSVISEYKRIMFSLQSLDAEGFTVEQQMEHVKKFF